MTDPLREALETALSVVLHELSDPDCTGEPPYDETERAAKRAVADAMRMPVVIAVRAALDTSGPVEGLRRAVTSFIALHDEDDGEGWPCDGKCRTVRELRALAATPTASPTDGLDELRGRIEAIGVPTPHGPRRPAR